MVLVYIYFWAFLKKLTDITEMNCNRKLKSWEIFQITWVGLGERLHFVFSVMIHAS